MAPATDVVTKAAQGQGRGLKALGIDVSGATSAADFLAAAQKNVAGASEAWIATNGTASVSNLKVGEAMEKVGGIIDKVSQVAVPLLAGALVGIVDVLTSSVGPAIQFVSDIMDLFGPVAAALALVLSAVLIPPVIAYTVAAGAAAVATLAAAAPFIAVGAAIAGVIFILKKLGILDVIMDKIQEVSKIVLPALSKAFEVVGGSPTRSAARWPMSALTD